MNLPSSPRTYIVIQLLLNSGERLPTLVDATTLFPTRVATRWAVRYRRYRVQSSTLASDLRVLGKVYTWASLQNIDLDAFLTSGNIFTVRQIESLALYLRGTEYSQTIRVLHDYDNVISNSSFDHHLSIVQLFLTWTMDTTLLGKSDDLVTYEQIAAARIHTERILQSLHIGTRTAQRILPLSEAEITTIRQAIGPELSGYNSWSFPNEGFSQTTCLRNWLMFEVSLNLGLRRGELLKLRMDGLPRGRDDGIRVMRFPDDPRDTRKREPAVKTAERIIPASRELLNALRAYITLPPPKGRSAGNTPYLFTTAKGHPVSIDTADDIIAVIGEKSELNLSWHRMRHTWAERTAKICFSKPNGLDLLMYLGGWTSPLSVKHYIQNTIAQEATELLQAHQHNEDSENHLC